MFRLKVADEPPDEIDILFKEYSQHGIMSMDDLCDFLVQFQGEEEGVAIKKHAQTIFDSLRHLNIFHRRGLHVEAFFRYLLSDLNVPLAEVHHDMNFPLAHYFLYTGHNSYLTGNQVSSASSTSAIIKALKKGVRVIELDLWPNSRGDDVLVHHGGTLTSSLKLKACLNAIKEYAFFASPFTQKNLLRIYPKGTRLNSSNYDPMIGWMHGAQMVAFNMQGGGHHLRYMEGIFGANGGCGYVKKPDILLNVGPNNEVFDPRAIRPVQKILQVLVYMGEGWRSDFGPTHFDFYSPPDFRVQVGIRGVPDDKDTKYSRTIEDDWVPVWNEEFSFPLTVPELALFYIKVVERDFSGRHDFGGQTCLPVSELRQGIRAVR
ncbi:Phosphoinositide phospholipase C 6 [Glycine soja]|nr:Phosphoinositide phospholipase C 6 [Glycine soja]